MSTQSSSRPNGYSITSFDRAANRLHLRRSKAEGSKEGFWPCELRPYQDAAEVMGQEGEQGRERGGYCQHAFHFFSPVFFSSVFSAVKGKAQ